MKTTSAAFLLITLLFTSIGPVFGQKGVRRRPDVKTETQNDVRQDPGATTKPNLGPGKEFAQFETVEAITDGGGALIRWEMASETANLGFLVYRLAGRGHQQVNENLITGSMSKLGPETMYGNKYEFFDTNGTFGSVYMIQAIGPDGTRVSSTTVGASYTSDIESKVGIPKAAMIGASTGQNSQLQNTLPSDLSTTQNSKTGLISTTEAVHLPTHRNVVNTPGVKIGVKKDGFYRVRLNSDIAPVSSLFNAGNTANWRLYRDGIEQGVIIGTDGSGVYMDFYGKAIETIGTDTAIYYLIVDANTIGKRIPSQRIKRVDSTGVSASYSASTSKRERVIYDPSILNGDAENFWGNVVINGFQKNVTVALTGVDHTLPTFTLDLDMQGYSSTVTPSVRIVLNGTEVGIANAAFPRGHYSAQFSVPTNLLVEGNNTFQLTSINGSGDASYFDTLKLQYNRAYLAETNRLLFTGAPTKSTTLSGFSSPNIRLFNIGADGSPIRLTGFNTQQDTPTSYSVLYPATRQRLQPIYAVEDSGLLLAPPVTVNNPSNLSSTVRNADLVIISYSHADFMTGSNTWADYRRSAAGGSFNVEVVDAADIYDEYSYGLRSGDAIRDFLQHVHSSWVSQIPSKKYVLLMGDASFDPKNFRNNGDFDHVPTKITTTIYGEVPADDLLADFNGDALADMAIGRVPARSGAHITTIFNKTTAFETPALQSLSRGIVFAYDKPNGYQFGVMSAELAGQIPGAPPTYVSRGLQPPEDPMTTDPNALSNLVNAINVPGGRYIVNYSGHGSQGRWDDAFLSNPSVPQLTNANGPAIFTMLTCLNGYFLGSSPGDESISEVLVKSTSGGGVVAWASSGKTTADVQMLMGRQFFQQVDIGNIKRMGDLVINAKEMTPANSDVRTTWILFGDPMLKVRQ